MHLEVSVSRSFCLLGFYIHNLTFDIASFTANEAGNRQQVAEVFQVQHHRLRCGCIVYPDLSFLVEHSIYIMSEVNASTGRIGLVFCLRGNRLLPYKPRAIYRDPL